MKSVSLGKGMEKRLWTNEEHVMNIATAVTADEYYPRYLTVMLYSLFLNNADEEIRVFVLHNGLSEKGKESLIRCTKSSEWRSNKTIIPVYVNEQIFEQALKTEFSVGTYFRLLMFDLLPDDLDRLLYLDVDLIVNGSLHDLYYAEFDGCHIIACSHGATKDEVFKGVKEGTLYPQRGDCFNAGVVLYDFPKMKAEYGFIVFSNYLDDKSFYYDQGILNYLLWDKTNYFPTELFNNRGHDHSVDITNSVILHYASSNPWELKFTKSDLSVLNEFMILEGKKKDCLNEYYLGMVALWWEYAKKSEYYLEFCQEAEIIHRYFMDRLTKNYFLGMENEYRFLKFESRLLEQMAGDKLLKKLERLCIDNTLVIYGMGVIGMLVYEYLKQFFTIPYYVDKYKKNAITLDYKSLDELKKDNYTVLVCIWKADEDIRKSIMKNTNSEVILLSQLL